MNLATWRRKADLVRRGYRRVMSWRRPVVLAGFGVGTGLALGYTAVYAMWVQQQQDPHGYGSDAIPLAALQKNAVQPQSEGNGDATEPVTQRDAPITEDERIRLADYMRSQAQQTATAMAAGEDPDRLIKLIAGASHSEQCYDALDRQVAYMSENGQLLHPTGKLSAATAECLNNALDAAGVVAAFNPGDDWEARISRFLTGYAVANDPTTQVVAGEPSPENLQIWRAGLRPNQFCREQIPDAAKAVAQMNDPQQAQARLENEALSIADCMDSQRQAVILAMAGQLPIDGKQER